MPTVQQILDDINLRYRNTFTTSQVLVWFNEEQRELFDILELDSPPYTFATVLDEHFYPFPEGLDISKIKTVTYEDNVTPKSNYVELPFLRNDDDQFANYSPFWTVVSNAFYLHVPDQIPDGHNVYIYLDGSPDDVTVDTLDTSPQLPVKYQEVLKLGVLKRIAMARKDAQMKSNYEADYEQKIADIMWARRLAEPEFIQPIDEMPRAGNPYGYGSFAYRFGWWGSQ